MVTVKWWKGRWNVVDSDCKVVESECQVVAAKWWNVNELARVLRLR